MVEHRITGRMRRRMDMPVLSLLCTLHILLPATTLYPVWEHLLLNCQTAPVGLSYDGKLPDWCQRWPQERKDNPASDMKTAIIIKIIISCWEVLGRSPSGMYGDLFFTSAECRPSEIGQFSRSLLLDQSQIMKRKERKSEWRRHPANYRTEKIFCSWSGGQ